MKLFFLLVPCFVFAQNVQSLKEIKAPAKYENIHVVKLSSDKHVTNFVIFVKNSVRAHKHLLHTETLFVLEGEARIKIGNETRTIKSGDFIVVAEGIIHSVEVTSKIPLKVLSVQTPEFLGKDRIFWE